MATKKNSTFINYMSEKLLHTNTTEDGSRSFVNVSFPCEASKSGYGSFAVNAGQVLPATRKDGSTVEGMKNILLGDADKTRKVSIQKGKKYVQIDMTNAEIAAAVAASRKAFQAARAQA